MNPNLKWRALSILLIILFCIYYLVGLPDFPKSFAQMKDNFGRQIKLGLDLQGGTHLILQVQVQEAISQETDQTVDRLTSQLRTKNIHYDEVRRVDDTHILVRNLDPAQLSTFRDMVSAQYANVWDLAPTAGDPSGYTLTLRAAAIAQIKDSTMTQSLETIERRINALGLTEPTIQRRGGRNDNEILVQLPGEGDPTRAKAVIQAGGQLELRLVEGQRAFSSESEALASYGGILPAGTELVPGRSETRNVSGSQETAHDLALVLRAGALPASIKYLEERTVGPSLGADSIRHGVQASVLSLVVVMLFMLVYYRLSGGNAVLALILNLVILLAVLGLFGAVLTLPGIAGVILTIGMGVDSNVLVFERIREELRNGKSSAAAVDAGFDKAFLTIIDTHVTTVVSAAFLGVFGTGPIRGFAITLVVGLVANIFTAVYVSKTIFQFHLTKMDRQAELSI